MPRIELGSGEAQLWYARPEKCAGIRPELESLLAAEELERYRKFSHEPSRLEFLLGRSLCRKLISGYLDADAGAIRFETGTHGRPELAWPAPPRRLRFNVSHSHGLVAFAFCWERDIGVDVESVLRKNDIDHIAPGVFSPEELQDFENARDPRARTEIFYRFWNLKEAYIKARGMGLAIPLQKFSFIASEADPIRIKIDPSLNDRAEEWQFWTAAPTNDHRAALAIRRGEGPDLRVIERRLEDFLGE